MGFGRTKTRVGARDEWVAESRMDPDSRVVSTRSRDEWQHDANQDEDTPVGRRDDRVRERRPRPARPSGDFPTNESLRKPHPPMGLAIRVAQPEKTG